MTTLFAIFISLFGLGAIGVLIPFARRDWKLPYADWQLKTSIMFSLVVATVFNVFAQYRLYQVLST